jgi:hypothetical protein
MNRIMAEALDDALGGLGLPIDEQLRQDSYELGVSVGASEVLRFVLPRLAEHIPDVSPLTPLLRELRLCYGDLTGDEVAA